jgi:RND family efflux transporter MFP subunit
MQNKLYWKGLLALTALCLVIGTAYQKGWLGRPSTTQAATPISTSFAVELSPSDIFVAQKISLTQGLPISGSVKAVQSAMVKARVAGEIMMLQVREGDRVVAGQVLAKIDPAEYLARQRQAQQQAEAAQAQVDVAQRQYDNNSALVNQGFISKTALDNSYANLQGAKATFQAAISALDVVTKAVEDCVLKAPISGQISQRMVQAGERVAPDTRLLEIVDIAQLELEATLSPTDALSVKLGQTATLKIEGTAEEVSAKVLRINPSTQAGSRSVLVYLGLQAHPLLRQGVFVQGSLGTQQIQTVAVPLESVRYDKFEPYVQTIQNGKVAHLPVTLGIKGEFSGMTVMALQALTEGTQVLAPGAGAVRDGTKVVMAKP